MTLNIKRRVGYYRKSPDGKIDVALQKSEFDDECFDELTEYIQVINDTQPIIIAFDIVSRNFNEVSESISKYRGFTVNQGIPIKGFIPQAIEGMTDLIQRISNFLASASMFLTIAESKLRSVFGKKSFELKMWNLFRQELHKDSFSYRFMYKLRNYSQHHGLPLSSVICKIDDMKNIEESTSLSVNLSKQELLKDEFNWGSLKHEIEVLEEQTNIYPHLSNYMRIIESILVKYVDSFRRKIADCYAYMSAFHRAIGIPENAVPVLFTGQASVDGAIPNDMMYIPVEQFQWVCRRYLEVKKNKA